jgi:hypothetical protein
VAIPLQPAVLVAVWLMSSAAVPQEPAAAPAASTAQEQEAPPVSLDRIREGVARTPALKLDRTLPTPTFRTTTEGRALMLPFQEHLRQQLELTPLQRQSRDWASRCCGIDVGRLFNGIGKALDRRKARQVREQIERELAELEAARPRAQDARSR